MLSHVSRFASEHSLARAVDAWVVNERPRARLIEIRAIGLFGTAQSWIPAIGRHREPPFWSCPCQHIAEPTRAHAKWLLEERHTENLVVNGTTP